MLTSLKYQIILLAVLIFFVALLARLWFIADVKVKPIESGDQFVYQQTALNLLHEGTLYSQEGYAFRPPLYPFFIAATYLLAGETKSNIFIAQSFLGALSAVILFLLLKEIELLAAVTGATLFSIHPLMLYFNKQIMTETLYIFLLLFLIYLAVKTLTGGIGLGLITGVVMGLTILCRSEAVLLFPLIALGIMLLHHGRRLRRVMIIGAMLCTAALILLPWIGRNFVVLGSPVITTNAGHSLYIGNNPEANGAYHVPSRVLTDLPSNEIGRNNRYLKEGISYIVGNPKAFLVLAMKKQKTLWHLSGNRVLKLADLLLLPLVLIGGVLVFRDKEKWHLYYFLLSPIVVVVITFSIFVAIPRYRTPIYPFFFAFVGVALTFISQKLIIFIRAMRPQQ